MDEQDVLGFHPEEHFMHPDTVSTTKKLFEFKRELYYNEGPLAFLPNTKDQFFFTGNYFTNSDSLKNKKIYERNRINTLKLFYATKNIIDSVAVWKVTPVSFSGPYADLFNSENFNVAHPAFNADGTKLYFSANVPMPGYFGSSDIFVSTF